MITASENMAGQTERAISATGKFAPLLAASVLGVFVITALVYITGGPISPLIVLYLPLVMVPSLLGSRNLGLVLAFLSGATYSTLAYLMLKGHIPAWDNQTIVFPKGGIGFQILGLCSGMVLVSILASYLAAKLRWSYSLVEESKRSILKLANEQASLMNQLPEGVITVNNEGAITSINQAAAQLLGVERPSEDLFSFSKLIDSISSASVQSNLRAADDGVVSELVLNDQDRNGNRPTLLLRVRAVLNEEGDRAGLLYTIQDITELRSIESKLADQENMARLLASRDDEPSSPDKDSPQIARFGKFIGNSAVMKKVYNLIERVGPSDATVMVVGESGTGKELVAKAIHSVSARAEGPFVAVNCGAIPEDLIESELFGHKKGSFTGADSDSPGLFRHADGGTIFLDEIGELPQPLQAKLLRAIQEKSVRPVGDTRNIPVDVRIIAATNRNLRREIEEGRFREDLYYRLNVIAINLPPLKDRRDDLPVLIEAILRRLVPEGRSPIIPPATLEMLLKHSYPGNVRELENILERAVVLGGEVILPEHLPDSLRSEAGAKGSSSAMLGQTQIIVDENIQFPVNLDELLSTVERHYLVTALTQTRGAKKRAATLLGMNFRSFRYRLEKFGLHEE